MKKIILVIAIAFSLSASAQSKTDTTAFLDFVNSISTTNSFKIQDETKYNWASYLVASCAFPYAVPGSGFRSNYMEMVLKENTLEIITPFTKETEIKTIIIGDKVYELKK